jgi:hypothetical protein
MDTIYIQLQINTNSNIDSTLVWVVYNLAGTVYREFPENETELAYNYKKQLQNGFISNTSS